MYRPVEELAILIVEDDEFQRAILRMQLGNLGITSIAEAGDGREALSTLAGGFRADVVICDLDMPDTDGMEFLRHLAGREAPPAVVISSAAGEAIVRSVEIMASQLRLRVLGTLAKPPTAEALRERLVLPATPDGPVSSAIPPEPGATELRNALASGQFDAHFQAKVDVRTGKTCGAEALARWNHPTLGTLAAGRFIEAIERHGLATALGEAMLAKTAAAARRWVAAGLDISIGVNVSAETLHETGFAERLLELVASHGIGPTRLVLEITESTAMRDVARSLETLSRLRMRGFGLAIDDFGKGHSSLTRLSRVPYTELKVDQAFVTGAADSPHLRAMLVACVDIAHKLGLTAVAEGVETDADLEVVRASGCDAAQGWHFGQPVDARAFLDAALARG